MPDLLNTRARNAARKALPDKPDQMIWHSGNPKGFGQRVRGDSAHWIYQFRMEGSRRTRRLTIGPCGLGGIPPADAHMIATGYALAVAKGEDPKPAVAESVTFKQAAALFRKRHIPRLQPSTQPHYDVWLRRLERHWKSTPLEDITPERVQRMMDKRALDDGRAASANQELMVLRRVLTAAGLRDRDNPARDSSVRREKLKERTQLIPTPWLPVIRETLEGWRDHRDAKRREGADVIALLLLTGRRAGEILNLRWDQIDGPRMTIPTKTGEKEFPLPAPAREILKRQPSRGLGGRVFPVLEGDYWKLYRQWQAVRRESGLPKEINLHDIRRTVGTQALEALGIEAAQEVLGHENISSTRRYTATHEGRKDAFAHATANRMAELMDAPAKPRRVRKAGRK